MKHFLVILLIYVLAVLSVYAQQSQGIQTNSGTNGSAISPRSTEQVTTTSGMPAKISYQGAITYVTSTGKIKPVKKGPYTIQFKLFDDKTAGSVQDSHTYNVVVDKFGVYTVTLGEDGTDQGNLATNIFNKLLWLQVTVLSGPETKITYPYALTPRVQLTSVPYSFSPWLKSDNGIHYDLGNVGIGIAPTTYQGLHLHNPSSWTAIQFTSNTTGTGGYEGLAFGLNTVFGDAFLYNFSNQPIMFGTNSVERMRITADGKVGIGTTTPASALDVDGDITVSGNVNYAAPKTGYVSGTGWASGRGLFSTSSFTYSWGLYNNGGGTAEYEVALNLPDGVTLTSVDLYGRDVSSGKELFYVVARQILFGGNSGSSIAWGTSGVPFNVGDFTATASTGGVVIDNSTYAYFLELIMPATSEIKYYGYRATYTYTSPGAISTPVAQPAINPVAVPQAIPGTIPSELGSVRLSSTGGR